jgi:hypothetical protein
MKRKSPRANGAPKSPLLLFVGGGAAVAVLLCCCGGGIGAWLLRDSFGGGGAVARNDDKKPRDTEPVKDPPRNDTTMTAAAFLEEFIDNEKAAATKYQGKVVEVTAEVAGVYSPHSFQVKDAQKKVAKQALTCGMICLARPDAPGPIGRLGVGQRVKVVGKFKESQALMVYLQDCQVTELEPSKLVTISAENLARDFEADFVAAQKRYRDIDMAVAGTVTRVEMTKSQRRTVITLKGGARMPVTVEVNELADVPIGGRVEVRARINGLPSERVALKSICFLAR